MRQQEPDLGIGRCPFRLDRALASRLREQVVSVEGMRVLAKPRSDDRLVGRGDGGAAETNGLRLPRDAVDVSIRLRPSAGAFFRVKVCNLDVLMSSPAPSAAL